jgi:hypothetical protein
VQGMSISYFNCYVIFDECTSEVQYRVHRFVRPIHMACLLVYRRRLVLVWKMPRYMYGYFKKQRRLRGGNKKMYVKVISAMVCSRPDLFSV